jgi:hypothetical protein
MKREFVFGGLIALALSVGASAQTTAGQQYPSTQDKDKDTVTVTGCLVPGAGGAVGTSGTTATTANPSAAGFMLINASKDGAPAATTTAGTSGTTASGTTAPAADAGKSFTLVGGDQEDLQKWVNSRVEIKGTIEASSAAPSMTGGSTSATTTTATSATPEKSAAQRLRITSVRQIASTCSAQQ